MIISTISDTVIILNALLIMSILLGVNPQKMPKGKRIGFLLGAFTIVMVQIWAALSLDSKTYADLYCLLAQLPCLLLFLWVSKRGLVKVSFVTLTTIFLSSPAIIVSNMLQPAFHGKTSFILLISLFVDLVMLVVIWRHMKLGFHYILDSFHPHNMLGFCMIPLLFNIMIYMTGGYLKNAEQMPLRILVWLITLAGFFLVMNIFAREKEVNSLRTEKDMLAMQASMAQQKMWELYRTSEKAKLYRHDMRHHLSLIEVYARQDSLDKIKEYLVKANEQMDDITPVFFCENETVNLILSSFADKAKKKNVGLSVKASLSKDLHIPDTELCSMLSNGIENALVAVADVQDKTLRKIFMQCQTQQKLLLIKIVNAYTGTVQMKDGMPISTESGHGFGCRSMAAIAEGRKGFCSFKADDGIFTLSVILPMDEQMT